ncbi:MAG: PIN domain-containing protein [Methylacidiphilales bacterium]|nr:PIN domain-containing protein [Candidatus Methylacidiphilales bacterium]
MVLVDSCVWIEASRERGDLHVKLALRALLDEYEAAYCGPVKLEVLGGARNEKRKALSYFFEAVPYLAMPEIIWDDAKNISWRLRDAGQAIPWNDILIACIALKQRCRVYSIDAHFQALSEKCGLLLYQPGYGGKYQRDVEG